MKAIVTKYRGPTNTKGSCVTATAEPKHKYTVGYHRCETPAALACAALLRRMNWGGTWVSGSLPDGVSRAWVCVSNESAPFKYATVDGVNAWELCNKNEVSE